MIITIFILKIKALVETIIQTYREYKQPKEETIMKYYDFTLTISGIEWNISNKLVDITGDRQGLEDALFEAGCDDALINYRYGKVIINFIRKAESMYKAIDSAIEDVKSVNLGSDIIMNVSYNVYVPHINA